MALNKIPLDTIARAYSIVSAQTGHQYPPIRPVAAPMSINGISGGVQTNGSGVCDLCFMNNCDNCNEDDGGYEPTTALESVQKGGAGGANCRAAARAKRQAQINSANASLAIQLTAACGSVAGAAACSGTAMTIIGAPISPATGVGVGCVVYVGCDIYQIYQYRQQIAIIEADYTMSVNGCN